MGGPLHARRGERSETVMSDALHGEAIERIRRNGRVARTVIIAAGATVCIFILGITAHEVATLPPSAPPDAHEAAYRRIVRAIEDHRQSQAYSRRDWWTPEDRAIEKMLYERLLEVERARGEVERDVAAARRIGRIAGEPAP